MEDFVREELKRLWLIHGDRPFYYGEFLKGMNINMEKIVHDMGYINWQDAKGKMVSDVHLVQFLVINKEKICDL